MVEISGFRIRAEVEKTFQGHDKEAVIEALEAFSPFLPVGGNLAYFHHYLRQSEGNTAFLWAALVDDKVVDMGLSSKDLEFAQDCLLNSPRIFSHTEQEVRLIAQFQVAKVLAYRHRVLEALAPYKNPADKVRGLGFNGHKLQALGFKGYLLGELIKLLNNRMAQDPSANQHDVEGWIQEFNNCVTRY